MEPVSRPAIKYSGKPDAANCPTLPEEAGKSHLWLFEAYCLTAAELIYFLHAGDFSETQIRTGIAGIRMVDHADADDRCFSAIQCRCKNTRSGVHGCDLHANRPEDYFPCGRTGKTWRNHLAGMRLVPGLRQYCAACPVRHCLKSCLRFREIFLPASRQAHCSGQVFRQHQGDQGATTLNQ